MSAEGKIIARIETQPADPEYGYERDDTILIHFTDGSALKVSGSSYEEVSLDHELVDAAYLRTVEHAAQGRREKERLKRLEREAWMALSCDERAAKNAEKRAKQGEFAMMMKQEFEGAIVGMMLDSTRMLYGDGQPRTVRYPCKNCGERACPNAPVKTIPEPKPFVGDTITIPKQQRKARRS